jgi:hypothetical protein
MANIERGAIGNLKYTNINGAIVYDYETVPYFSHGQKIDEKNKQDALTRQHFKQNISVYHDISHKNYKCTRCGKTAAYIYSAFPQCVSNQT